MVGEEHAKAIQEVAKFGQKSVDAANEAAGFFRRAFGDAIDHVSQAMADKAAGYRIVNRARVVTKTRAKLEELGVTDLEKIEFRNGIPLLEAISDESDETLQDVWAAYFANALNPENTSVSANRQLIDIIRKLEPTDLNVLNAISKEELCADREDQLIKTLDNFPGGDDALNQSMARLTALGLFSFDNGLEPYVEGSPKVPCWIVIKTVLGEFTALPILMVLKNSIE